MEELLPDEVNLLLDANGFKPQKRWTVVFSVVWLLRLYLKNQNSVFPAARSVDIS